MLETFTITPTEFRISILETGYIHNVNAIINVNGYTLQIPCYHHKRLDNNIPIWDIYIGYYTFYETSSYAIYYFKYNIEGKKFETDKCIFKIEDFYDA